MKLNALAPSLTGLAGTAWLASAAHAAVTPNPLFADHAVLQQGTKVPVWGTADPGEAVTVEIGGQSASTTAGNDGKWLVRLAPMKAGGPFTLTIAGQNKIVLEDILVGEVWVAAGQSNMERQLGPRVGQQPIYQWEKEVAAARHPQIRHFGVAQEKSLTPLATVKGRWNVCSPETVGDFTAVGYFFGRDLNKARHVPVGLIHSSWGGTPAEAWTSEAGLRPLPDFADTPEQIKMLIADPEAARRNYQAKLEAWFVPNDAGSAGGKSWNDPALDTEAWKTMALPTLWEDAGEPDLNGVVWFRKTIHLPVGAVGAAGELQLGMVDDIDTTWVNGVKVGATVGYNLVRKYAVPAGLLKPGRNVIAVRVLDTGGGGGIWGQQKPQLVFTDKPGLQPIDLSGPWRYRIGMNLKDAPPPPTGVTGDSGTPTVLYNAMIAPLVPYAVRGVIWYQGESNVNRPQQYRSLFPAMIADWRQAWGEELPFLFVQIAPHNDMTPELRDAQLWAWQHTPKTAMAVTTDCGDANDIHPTHKQPVGARLALAARALVYGERVEYSGPVFESMRVDGNKALLTFTHLGGGLLAKGGALKGFTVSGDDIVFLPARAEIRGKTLVVTSEAVARPTSVRYGWANVPDGNLFNKAGLPASPFRTDAPSAAPAQVSSTFGRDTALDGPDNVLGGLVGPDGGVVSGPPGPRGSLDREIIRRIIRRHINEVKYCYEQELTKQPDLMGRIMVQFTISATGDVIASVLQSSTMGNGAVENCAVQALRRWQFPKPLGGGIVIVSYPFVLSPASIRIVPGQAGGGVLDIVPITVDRLFVHRSTDAQGVPSNGLVVATDEGLLLVDTAWTDAQTAALLDWGSRRYGKRWVGAVITHDHADRDGGIATLLQRGIPVSALDLTVAKLARRGVKGVATLLEARVGATGKWHGLEAFYPGPGHTGDNIVVALPDQKTLYGGCLVKATHASDLGFTGDADLKAWPAAVAHVQEKYPWKTIIPGHGPVDEEGKAYAHTLDLLRRATVTDATVSRP